MPELRSGFTWLVVVALGGAVASLALMGARVGMPSLSAVPLYLWVAGPELVAIGVSRLQARQGRPGPSRALWCATLLVVAGGVFVYASMLAHRRTSTEVLAYVFVPVYQVVALGLVLLVGILLGFLVRPRP